MKRGKKYQEVLKKVDRSKSYTLKEAAALTKECSYAKFDETVELAVKLTLKKSQSVRDTVVLPNQFSAQKATPAPPVGPALGPHGVSAPQFVQQFNDKTKGFEAGLIIPVIITVYSDKSFTFILKTPPAAVLIKKALGIQTASGTPNKVKVGKLTDAQLTEIAQTKLEDLNAYDIDAAKKIIAGTARSMGVEVEK